jgi:hypothetical protein
MSNYLFQRPSDPRPVQAREAVPGRCTECGFEALQRYPALSEGGWFMVTKCQNCLYSVKREKWNRLGHVVLLTDSL